MFDDYKDFSVQKPEENTIVRVICDDGRMTEAYMQIIAYSNEPRWIDPIGDGILDIKVVKWKY